MKGHYIAHEYCISYGVGESDKGLPSFDKALLDAGVGNYNLVKLSSTLPADCKQIDVRKISEHIKEGSLLPTAYATITSDKKGESIVSVIGVGHPKDKTKVGVIMEYSAKNKSVEEANKILDSMIIEAFNERGWELDFIQSAYATAIVKNEGEKCTTFACIAEW